MEKYKIIEDYIVGLTAFVCIVIAAYVIYNWQTKITISNIFYRIPGLDNTADRHSNREEINIGERFQFFADLSERAAKLNGVWPRFRGENFNNVTNDNIKLKDSLTADLIEKKWGITLGEGYAAPVIYKGKVYLLDYLEEIGADALRCFDLLTGKELWRRWYNITIARNHGKSRTAPAVNDTYVLSIGPLGHTMCLDRNTGDLIWSRDMIKDYGAQIPQWYTGQCPLIDGNIAALAPAGDTVLLTGIDIRTGETIWETPNTENIKMSHSSIIKMNIQGKNMYVYCGIGGIAGVSADIEDSGKLLWINTEWRAAVIAPSPVYIGNDRIFSTAGYGAGGAIYQISYDNNDWSAKLVKSWKPNEGIACEQQTPVIFQNMLVSILPNDAGINRQQLVAAKINDNLDIHIQSGSELRLGLGPYIIADNKIFALNDRGVLFILTLKNNKFELSDKKKILNGSDSWGPIAVADGFMLLRDSIELICLDLREN